MEQIDVQLTEADIKIIKKYTKEIEAPNCYLEVGVHQGGSILQALEAAKPDVEIYGIDIVDNFKLKDTRANFICSPSVEAAKTWDKPIGVLFIDGNHDEAGKDFEAWEKFVVKGGVILFHDFAPHSPKVIVDCSNIINDRNDEYKQITTEGIDFNKSSIFQIRKL